MDWTTLVWRILCTLTVLGGVAAVTAWPALPPAWQAVAVAPGLLVTLLIATAGYADSRKLSKGKSDA